MTKIIRKLILSFGLAITVLAGVLLSQPVEAAVGETIAETFS